MNPIIEYQNKIHCRDIVASQKIKKVYKHLVDDIINNNESEWEYDEDKAYHAIEFIERFCKHSKG